MLVEWGVGKADEMGVEAFVEGSRFGRHLYEQYGFQVTEFVVIQHERWPSKRPATFFFMHRPARKS